MKVLIKRFGESVERTPAVQWYETPSGKIKYCNEPVISKLWLAWVDDVGNVNKIVSEQQTIFEFIQPKLFDIYEAIIFPAAGAVNGKK